ncbi:hypothetical protein ACFQV2_25555 [Actinokineospora soli]|uniref:Enolpyruvate transferase domain-containing protein n=1 Tax=Actinokineospora soli TaxID=1048753 RepID=A0ABW2TS93_9PSEU
MAGLLVHGGQELHGEVAVSGFKHSLVTAVAAAAAADSVVEVRNCPDIAETTVLSGLLTALGADVRRTGGALVVRAGGLVGEPSPTCPPRAPSTARSTCCPRWSRGAGGRPCRWRAAARSVTAPAGAGRSSST